MGIGHYVIIGHLCRDRTPCDVIVGIGHRMIGNLCTCDGDRTLCDDRTLVCG